MDRLSRYINNQKQDKIQAVRSQPSVSTMREGEEVLYQGKNKPLRRYRKQNGILWYSDMTRDGNEYVDKNLTVKNNATINSNLAVGGTAIISRDATVSAAATSNTLDVRITGADGDNGVMIVRADTSTGSGNLLGAIGFDSTDGNVPSSVLEASAYIGARASQNHGASGKGGHLVIGTTAYDDADDTASNEVARFTDGGNLLIGRVGEAASTLDPNLEVDGYISFDGFLSRAGTGGLDNGQHVMNFFWDGTYIDGWVGTNEVWPNETSDYRIKENIVDISDGVLEKINALKPIHFTQKEIGIFKKVDEQRVSFVAHELEEQFPDIVKGDKDAVDDNGDPIFQSYNNTQLTAYLIKAVQELSAEVEKLKG